MIRYVLLLLTLLGSHVLIAQGETNIWYFGYGAGLDFNNDPPVALTDGILVTDEGCATICDAEGNLLFYSNGETIYNQVHQIMPNGTDLGGHFSSTQSVIIVPQPLSDHIYYLFTVAAGAGFNGAFDGLSYSVIDMDLDNGRGEVIEKNVPLIDYTTEKQTAVRHSNGRDIWIVTHRFESDAFYSFLLTCDGINEEPVISNVGTPHIEPNIGCCNGHSTLGCMKSSPDNQKMAVVWSELTSYNAQAGTVSSDWYLELFDFDNTTGELFAPLTITNGNGADQFQSYSVCFSPDNTKLYQGVRQDVPSYKILQYDLTAIDIPTSQTIITEEYTKAFGTMEIGPDGKIYIARTNGHQYLSVLHQPNELGMACDYEKEGVSLEGINSTWGLPNILYDYSFETSIDFFPADTSICTEETLTLDMSLLNADEYLWSDGSIFPELTIDTEGWHWLETVSENCGTGRDSIYVSIENCDCTVIFPNVFSPNGDATNDQFEAVRAHCDYEFYDLKIFSRWGETVFATQDKNETWDGFLDGQQSAMGVYVYCLNYRVAGSTRMEQVTGDVTLVR